MRLWRKQQLLPVWFKLGGHAIYEPEYQIYSYIWLNYRIYEDFNIAKYPCGVYARVCVHNKWQHTTWKFKLLLLLVLLKVFTMLNTGIFRRLTTALQNKDHFIQHGTTRPTCKALNWIVYVRIFFLCALHQHTRSIVYEKAGGRADHCYAHSLINVEGAWVRGATMKRKVS